jgi:competence protein ComEC
MESDDRRTSVFPLAQLASVFAVGILVGQLTAPFPLVIGGALFCPLAALTFLLLSRLRLATVSLFLAFTFCGATLGHLEMRGASPERVKQLLNDGGIGSGKPVEVTGVLQRNPEISWDSVYLTLRVEGIRVNGSDKAASGVVTLITPLPANRIGLEELELHYGARIRVMTRLERANSFRNPGVSPFTEYLDRKGYDATGFIKSPLLIERLDDHRIFLPLALLYDWRSHLQKQFDSQFARDTAGVLDAALLGNRYNLSRSTEERFREGGTFHVLVISGLHITFLGGLIFFVSRRLTRNRTTQYAASVTIVWAYSVAVGAEPSILRAALMFTVVMLAPLLSRRASALNGLGAVAIILLMWKPSNLLDPSFQLTFVSVLAILVVAWPLLHNLSAIGSWRPARVTPYPPACPPWLRNLSETLFWNERAADREMQRVTYKYTLLKSSSAKTLQRLYLQEPLRFAFAALVVSVSVQIALLPFLIIYFHRFSVASFVLNIFVSVVMGALALTALAAVAISPASTVLAAPLIVSTNVLNWLMVHSVDPFTQAHVASIRLPEYNGWPFSFYALYYAPLITLVICLSKWKPLDLEASKLVTRSKPGIVRVAVAAQLFVIALLIFHPFSDARNEGTLRVDFLDVGQGDSALVTMPDNTTLLIDGGGKPGPFSQNTAEGDGTFERQTRSIGEAVVSEYLWWRGLDQIDYILATHADADHIDGLNDVARNFAVRAALAARAPRRDPEYAKFSHTLIARGVPVQIVGGGDILQFGDVSATVLWPVALEKAEALSANNDSVVLRLQYGKTSILLTADIEAPAESALLKLDKSRERLTAEVVKVAHHGSGTSSTEEFIAATQSGLAIIPVGQVSMFGHPSAEVVKRWRDSGARVLTTGHSGLITVKTDGQNLSVETFVKGAE